MNAPKRHNAGFTLVELLVVIAIIALIAGVAVPGMARLMGYGRDNVGNAARDVYTLLRAANIYAATFRVNTAVVYLANVRTDSVTNDETMVIDGLGMARARTFTETEIDELEANGEDADEIKANPDSVYVLVLGGDGRLRQLPEYTCIQVVTDQTTGAFAATENQFEDVMTEKGARSILLYGEERIENEDPDPGEPLILSRFTRIKPRAGTEFTGIPSLNGAFPAHVFSPMGTMVTPNTTSARFVLPVGFAPDADPEDRYTAPNYETETGGTLMDPINVELYPATGRVKIAS